METLQDYSESSPKSIRAAKSRELIYAVMAATALSVTTFSGNSESAELSPVKQQSNQQSIKDDTREEFDILLQDPLAGVKPNSALTYSIGETIGYLLDEIERVRPDINESPLNRVAILAGVGGAAFMTKLVTHEYGHARAMRESYGEAEIEFFPSGPFGAATTYTRYPVLMSVAGKIAVATAGLSQEEEAAKYARIINLRTRKEEPRDPLIELPHATTQLINKFAIPSYVAMAGRGEGFGNDIDFYLAASQIGEHRNSIALNSLIPAVLSGSTIDSTRKTVGYLLNPKQKVKNISLKVGDVDLFLPELSYYLTPEGAYRSAAFFADVDNQLVRLEAGSGRVGQSLEVQLYDVKLGGNVSVSPYLAVSKREKGRNTIYRAPTNIEKLGGKAGAEFDFKISDDIALTTDVGYRHYDLMTQYVVPTGSKTVMEGDGESGLTGWMGITVKK